MTDRDELRDIWQSQPVEKGGEPVPKFRLIDDATMPFYTPLSLGRRISYAVGLIWMVVFVWRDGGTGWLHYVAVGIAVALALAGLGVLLRSQDLSQVPQPEETISSYRSAIANEFRRQFRIERLIVVLLFGGLTAVSALDLIGKLLVGGAVDMGLIAVMAFSIAALSVGKRLSVRAAKSVLSRLTDN
jgi:hypothetical protein